MSYILDAIKKAEKQRQMDQVPTLESTVAFHPDPVSRFAWKSIVAVLVVVALVASLVWYRVPVTTIAADLGQKSWAWAMTLMPVEDIVEEIMEDPAEVPNSAQPGAQLAAESAQGDTAQQVQAEVETGLAEPELPAIADADRRRLEQIRLSVISYSADSNKRFIMDGTELLREGDLLQGYPILKIRQNNVLLDVNGTSWEIRL
jgi:general secretion pathway protein B